MKKILTLSVRLMIVCMLAVSFQSCKKKRNDSPGAKLSGKWKLNQLGLDYNNNSTMDPAEAVAADSFQMFLAFGGDGTGTATFNVLGMDFSSNFTWQLINNNADIHIKAAQASTFLPISEGDLHINNLSESDLVIRDDSEMDSTGMATWLVFKKLK